MVYAVKIKSGENADLLYETDCVRDASAFRDDWAKLFGLAHDLFEVWCESSHNGFVNRWRVA